MRLQCCWRKNKARKIVGKERLQRAVRRHAAQFCAQFCVQCSTHLSDGRCTTTTRQVAEKKRIASGKRDAERAAAAAAKEAGEQERAATLLQGKLRQKAAKGEVDALRKERAAAAQYELEWADQKAVNTAVAAVQQGKVARKVVERKLSFGRRPPEHVKFVKVAQREVDGKPVGTLQYGTDAKGTGAKELQLSGISRIEHARDRCELRVFSSERLKPLTIAFADAPTVDQWAIGLAKLCPGATVDPPLSGAAAASAAADSAPPPPPPGSAVPTTMERAVAAGEQVKTAAKVAKRALSFERVRGPRIPSSPARDGPKPAQAAAPAAAPAPAAERAKAAAAGAAEGAKAAATAAVGKAAGLAKKLSFERRKRAPRAPEDAPAYA